MGNPYQPGASHLSQFPFASRSHATNAPLFYSATDEFREEDDEEEHEREVADFYALQRSRRQFGGSRLEESSEAEDEGSRGSGLENSGDGRNKDERGHARGTGIKSSWREEKSSRNARKDSVATAEEGDVVRLAKVDSNASSNGRGKMVDVGLESAMQSSVDGHNRDEPPDDLAFEIPPDDDPPSIQQFRKPPTARFEQTSPFIPQETDAESAYGRPRPPDSDSSSAPPTVSRPAEEPPRHDAFWGSLYLISLAALFSSFFLVYLHTTAPPIKRPLGDTIYTTLHASYSLLARDTLVAVIVSLLWLAVLRSYVRPLVYAILVAVPVIFSAFSLYPFISSFQGQWRGASIQDKAMRWLSIIPGAMAVVWTYTVYRDRHCFGKAISILEFSCRILAANPGLSALGFATLIGVITWTWIWMTMFTRVFLGGHLSNAKDFFVLNGSTWWLGAFFVLVYLWTVEVGSGIQRATTAATVSQWYFHRLTVPAPTSRQVILAAFSHSTSTLFGTVCLSTLLALLTRLPFIIVPRRIIALATLCPCSIIPSPIATLTNPLTLTYAAIHSQPLVASSKALTRLSFLSPPKPGSAPFRGRDAVSGALLPYTLSLLLLRATRVITSLALGFGAWVNTARQLVIGEDSGARGSLYAYVVGLIAGAIGWGVLGAIDGVLTGFVDAALVYWAREGPRGAVRYCREAEYLFGEEEGGDEEQRGFLRP